MSDKPEGEIKPAFDMEGVEIIKVEANRGGYRGRGGFHRGRGRGYYRGGYNRGRGRGGRGRGGAMNNNQENRGFEKNNFDKNKKQEHLNTNQKKYDDKFEKYSKMYVANDKKSIKTNQ